VTATTPAFEVRRTGAADYPRHIKALLLGAPKSGKTTAAATFPNAIFADCEAGLMSIAHRDVPYVSVDESSKLDTLLFMLGDDALRASAAERLGMPAVETLVIDTLDAFQELLKRERLAAERRTLFDKQDWGWLKDTLTGYIRRAVALPMHVVLTCHIKTTKDDTDRIIAQPSLQGGISEEVAGMVGFALLAERDRQVNPTTGEAYTRYQLRAEGDERNPHLGNRAGGRLAGTVDPDFKHLYDAAFEGVELPQRETTNLGGGDAPRAAALNAPSGQGAATPPAAPDDANPITDAALAHLSKMFAEFGFLVPDTAREWTLGHARSIARMFVAIKEDVAGGDDTREGARGELRRYLERVGAWVDPDTAVPAGPIEDVLRWVGDDADRARQAFDAEIAGKNRATLLTRLRAKAGIPEPAPEPAPEPVPDPAPAADPAPAEQPAPAAQDQPDAAQADAQAVADAAALLTDKLGATPITDDADDEQADVPTPVQTAAPAPDPQPVAPVSTPAPAPVPVALVPAPSAAAPASTNGELPRTLTPADVEIHRNALMRLEDLDAAPLCMETGQPVDDLDIARLALMKEGRWLTTRAFVDSQRAKRAAAAS